MSGYQASPRVEMISWVCWRGGGHRILSSVEELELGGEQEEEAC